MALNVLSAESRFGPIGPYLKWTWHTRESLGSKLRKKLKELLTKVFVTGGIPPNFEGLKYAEFRAFDAGFMTDSV